MQFTKRDINKQNRNGEVTFYNVGDTSSQSSSGGVTLDQVRRNFVSIEFFKKLFQAHDSTDSENILNIDPNDTDSTITDLEFKFGSWSSYFISALGRNSSGGGGGGSVGVLNDLDDVDTTGASNGKVLTYQNGMWVPGTGGGSGSVSWADITDKPTTLSGYGITDAIPLAGSDRITGKLEPNTNNSIDLGSSSYRWRYVYGVNGSFSSSLTVGGTDVSLAGHTHSASDITSGTFAAARIPTGISITGNAATATTAASATKATQDGDGNTISSTYLKLSGGTMTGHLNWNDSSSLSGVTSTLFVLCIDAFADGGETHYINTSNLSVGKVGGYDQLRLMRHFGIDSSAVDNTQGAAVIGFNPNSSLPSEIRSKYGAVLQWSSTYSLAPSATSPTSSWYYQIIATTEGHLFYRRRTNGGAWGNMYSFLTSGNYTTWLDSVYVNASGDTMSGSLTFSGYGASSWIGGLTNSVIKFTSTAGYLSLLSAPTKNGRISLSTYANNGDRVFLGYASNSKISDGTDNSFDNQIAWNAANGMVGINVANPSQKLHVDGNILATGAVTALSDMRRKSPVSEVNTRIEDLANLPIFYYRWKMGYDDDMHIGTSAQEVQKLFPELVIGKEDLSVNYPVLGTTLGILNSRKLTSHEKEIKALKKENKALKERIKALEDRV